MKLPVVLAALIERLVLARPTSVRAPVEHTLHIDAISSHGYLN